MAKKFKGLNNFIKKKTKINKPSQIMKAIKKNFNIKAGFECLKILRP